MYTECAVQYNVLYAVKISQFTVYLIHTVCTVLVYVSHREITLIELQSLIVFGCTALLFMVGATASTHDREEGWDNF